MPFKYHKIYKAPSGHPGESREKYGKNAEDLVLYVPLGTVIKNRANGHVLFVAEQVLDQDHQLLKGWDGWAGNMHFKNSILQYPDFCLNGEPWQYLELELELQLLADVWLIGTPSVGKSSIINMVSNAKAQVAEYHFTTITPNLGSVSFDGVDWNVIDIPGLIEWASDGKGLGIEFLRHILKCSIFNFVLDLGRWDNGIQEFGVLWNEILTYCRMRFAEEYGVTPEDIWFTIEQSNTALLLTIWHYQDEILTPITQKVIIWTINKSDESEDQELRDEYQNSLTEHIIETIQQSTTCHIDSTTTKSLIRSNTIWTSTYLHEGIEQQIYLWKNLITEYNHVSDIAWYTYDDVHMDRPHDITLVDTQDIREIDGYLEAKPYLDEEWVSDQSEEEVEEEIYTYEEIDLENEPEDDEDDLEEEDEDEIFGDKQWDDEVFYDHRDPTISEDKITHKNTVSAIIYDTARDQYIVTEQKGNTWQSFVTWWVDEEENTKKRIIRELNQQLSFSQIDQIIELWTINTKYFHPSTKQYIQWTSTFFYVEVDGDNQWLISKEEQKIQTVHYLEEDEVADWINVSYHHYFWEMCQSMIEHEDEDEDDSVIPTVNSDTPIRDKVNIRSIYEPDITRIVYMVQWGNDQAEQWFWKYMQKSWGISWLKKHKVKPWDILTFDHPYYGIEERKIIFEA